MNNTRIQKLALGTVQFGLPYGISNAHGTTTKSEVAEILLTARKYHIDTLDTASAYGDSEKVLGEIVASDFLLVSKFLITSPEEKVADLLAQSLGRLKQNRLYAYLSHGSNSLIENPSIWDELYSLKEQNTIGKIGYSLYAPSELELLLRSGYFPDIVQVPFNFIDTRFMQYFPELKEKGVEIHTRSAFLQGLLLMNPGQLTNFFQPVASVLEHLAQSYSSVAERAAALLDFCLNESHVDKVVIGVNTNAQLIDNIQQLVIHSKPLKSFATAVPEQILMPNLWPVTSRR